MAEYFCLQIPGWEWVQMWIVLAKHTSNVGFPAATFGKLGSASVRKMHFLFSKIWIADETFKNILNMLTKMYLIVCTKAFVGDYSFKMPPVWRNQSHQVWFWFILQILNSPWSHWWTLSVSSLHRISTGLTTGDLFSFSETNWEFYWLCVWDYCLGEMSILVSSSLSW